MTKRFLIAVVLGCAASPLLTSSVRAEVQREDFRIEADLIEAADNGDTRRVRDLLDKGAKLETRDAQTTWTPLMWAARRGHVATVKLLLARGARVNVRSAGSAKTYLPLAYGTSKAPQSTAEAPNAPQSLFASANNGITPLILASAGGYNLAAKLLLDKGANVNAQTSSGESALEAAAFKGYLPLVQTLLNRGAKVDTRNARGQTPLVNAVLEGHAPVVKLLLGKGADPNAIYGGRYSLLALSRYFGHDDITRQLRRAGARSAISSPTKTAVPKIAPRPKSTAKSAAKTGAPAARGNDIIILN